MVEIVMVKCPLCEGPYGTLRGDSKTRKDLIKHCPSQDRHEEITNRQREELARIYSEINGDE